MSNVLEITDPKFEAEVFNVDKPVLVYFWASWCGPCRLVSPSIQAIASSYGERHKVVKLEVDANPDAVSKCKVEGVPAIRLFKNSQLLASHEGAIGKQQLETILSEHLN
ncbi:MAG: thioredoxin family protein [Cyanobacteria bacterium P01_G01_bin.49]